MDLVTMRSEVRDLVDDPSATDFSDAVVNTMLNQSYEDLVNELETIGPQYNIITTTPPHLTVPSASPSREFGLASATEISPKASNVRRIVDIVHTNTSSTDVFQVQITPYINRNRRHGEPVRFTRTVSRTSAYVFRDSAAEWFVGFVDKDWAAAKEFDIYYAPRITALSGDSDVPTQLPEEFHRLIVYRASILAKLHEARDTTGLERLYIEGLDRMRRNLTAQVSPSRVRRF